MAERGSFTASAQTLGYTQSAVSRQVAALEQAVGARLFERDHGGAALTAAGHALLRHAIVALDALDAADRELHGVKTAATRVRLGFFATAGSVLVSGALTTLRRQNPAVTVTTRESTTPALVRALRAGTLDLGLLSSRPPYRSPDTEDPPLRVEPLLGIWPGLPGRPNVRHTARDWLTKLQLVAAGAGITTAPSMLVAAIPSGVRLVDIEDVPAEVRRVTLVRPTDSGNAAASALADALRQEAADISD